MKLTWAQHAQLLSEFFFFQKKNSKCDNFFLIFAVSRLFQFSHFPHFFIFFSFLFVFRIFAETRTLFARTYGQMLTVGTTLMKPFRGT